MRHVILVGLPGVGKTTVGRAVAERLGVGFVDLDEEIVKLDGRAITTIFSDSGEPVFRSLERMVTESSLGQEPSIIASGGGWAANVGAVELAQGVARRIYMKASPAVVASRVAVARDERPLLLEGDLERRLTELLSRRAGAYEAAEYTVDTERVDAEGAIYEVASVAGAWLAEYVGAARPR